ncbi:MAG: type IV pilus secretin PilQ [Nitrospirae bacterium]|nr:type IV pilus secretin PilQ [Nitrospirota bacterium]
MKKSEHQKKLFLLITVMVLALVAGCASRGAVADAPPAEVPPVITDIRLQDDSVTIVSNKAFVYTMYKGNDPYRMTVDIPDMGAGAFTQKIVSDKAGIAEVVPQAMDSPARMLKINLVLHNPSVVTPSYKDNSLTLAVKAEEPAAVNEQKEPVAAAPQEPEKAAEPAAPEQKEPEAQQAAEPEKVAENTLALIPGATEINKIEIGRAGDVLKIIIQGNGGMTPNVFPLDERIVIDIPGVALRAAVPKTVVAPLKGIRAGKHKDKVRLVLDLSEKTRFEVTAVGRAVEVALKTAASEGVAVAQTEPAAEKVVKNVAVSEPVKEVPAIESKEPNKEPVKEVTLIEPRVSNKETVRGQSKENAKIAVVEQGAKDAPSDPSARADGGFGGKKISLDFQDAEVGPIFRLLADVNGYNLVLDPSVKGKITIKLMNVPWDQALSIILNTFNLSKSIEGNILWIAPQAVFTKIIDERSAAKASQEKAEELVQDVLRINYATSGEVSAAITAGRLQSPRGTITSDTRMNSLIIKDTQSAINKIRELVKIMDVPKPQVMIEAKIVEVGSSYSETLGIRWGGAMSIQQGVNPISGTFSVNSPVVGAGSTTSNPGGAVGMTIGAANSLKVDLSLSALESIGKSRTLSNPKILTMDNESATIQQGTTFFIPTVSQSGTSSQAQTATLSLTVTPKITPDGYVQLKVQATDNSLEAGTAGASAVVNTKSLSTQAIVKNGETLVLGGIYRVDVSESSDMVPLLSRIPGLGWLFKTKQQIGPSTKELMIFITPTIVVHQAENK